MNIPNIYCVADHILSPLANGSTANYTAAKNESTGIKCIDNPSFHPTPTHCAKFDSSFADEISATFSKELTLLENLMVYSIQEAISQTENLELEKTGLFISTTKGNVSILEQKDPNTPFDEDRIPLSALSNVISKKFGFSKNPVVVSNACISGVSALLAAKRFIEIGEIDHAIVCGGDLISSFIVTGFHAFMAISDAPCKPYDKNRNGITLGEGVATMILSKSERINPNVNRTVKIMGGANSNDANHISGPSRTGEGLVISMRKAFAQSALIPADIDLIAAHGTATPYNDEMESIAFNRMDLGRVPLNSLKGYFGHTLGAAGILESIVGLQQLNDKTVLATKGLEEIGVSETVNASYNAMDLQKGQYLLKTISGFGGFNASIIFEMEP